MDAANCPLLRSIDSPHDLRRLPLRALDRVASELRCYLIDTVCQKGGHFAAGLGVVELAVALHYVYQTPYDRLLWDVGHQAYPHKVLTGRREGLGGIKLKGGLAPFPARQESEYDAFGVGHSSTSLSAAFGMAIAATRTATPRRIVAVIGDGAMSAGIAFEALNHIGSMNLDILIVLNDNDMSISEATGAFSNYLAELLSGQYYAKLRERGPLLITHNGISGPAVLRLSAWGARTLHEKAYRFSLRVNWLPELNEVELRTEFQSRRQTESTRRVNNSPICAIPARLWEKLVSNAGIFPKTTWTSLTRAGRNELIRHLRVTELEVDGKSLNKEEFVTCGGVRLREINFKTMGSRITPNLYFAGELLDIDGITGGFNFQAAWTTGWIAGHAMAGVEPTIT